MNVGIDNIHSTSVCGVNINDMNTYISSFVVTLHTPAFTDEVCVWPDALWLNVVDLSRVNSHLYRALCLARRTIPYMD